MFQFAWSDFIVRCSCCVKLFARFNCSIRSKSIFQNIFIILYVNSLKQSLFYSQSIDLITHAVSLGVMSVYVNLIPNETDYAVVECVCCKKCLHTATSLVALSCWTSTVPQVYVHLIVVSMFISCVTNTI